jgi:transposase
MLSLGSGQRYFLYAKATDMRKGFDGLGGLVRNDLGRDPMGGEVYIFLNRQRTVVKLLAWDRSGWVLYSKRLERGSYELPKSSLQGGGAVLRWDELVLMLEGISLESVQRRLRYGHGKENAKKG